MAISLGIYPIFRQTHLMNLFLHLMVINGIFHHPEIVKESLFCQFLRPTESLRHPIKRMLTTCLSLRFPWLLVTEAEASFREVEH